MNRIEELTSRLIDGTISDADVAELDGLVRSDDRAVGTAVKLVELEIALRRQMSSVEVSKQPAGQPMRFLTPQATATVLGTRLTLQAGKDSTRLQVDEGRVGLKRDADGAEVQVPSGHYAVASPGEALVVLPVDVRVTDGLLALYRFDETSGDVMHDSSGVGAPLDLHIEAGQTWRRLSPCGLAIESPSLIASDEPAMKISAACRASGQITVEAWVKPANLTQHGPARIVTMSPGTDQRNFTLGQGGNVGATDSGGDYYVMRLRTTQTTANGEPPLASARQSAATRPTHVVYTCDATGDTRLYIDGALAAQGRVEGDFSPWSDAFRLGLANEFSHDRPWLGEIYLVAVYARALTPQQVQQNDRSGF